MKDKIIIINIILYHLLKYIVKEKNLNFATRQLIRSSTKGYLATELTVKNDHNSLLFEKKKSIPYCTFVMVAFDYDCSPLILLSNLSEHTKNIFKNNNVSIMFYEEQQFLDYFPKFKKLKTQVTKLSYEDPMSRPRVTVIGNIEKSNLEYQKKRFILRHPESQLYASFADMNIYKLNIKSAHLTGGFAKVKWFKTNELNSTILDNFSENEFSILEHMNEQHQESINLYTKKLFNIDGTWKIVGIDSEGFDLRSSKSVFRYIFDKSIKQIQDIKMNFIKLHKKAANF